MPRGQRRSFAPKFKAKLVLELLSGTASPAELCRKHNIKPLLFAHNLFTQAAHGSVPQLPKIPAARTTVSVGGADPTVSLVDAVQATNGIVSVSVQLDHPDPAGSTGMPEAHLALTYDPTVLRVPPSDITLGSIPGLGTGWQVTSEEDAATGQAPALNSLLYDKVPGQLASQPTVPEPDQGNRTPNRLARTPNCQVITASAPNTLAHSLAQKPQNDQDLAKVIQAWPTLPEPIRRAMLALIGRE